MSAIDDLLADHELIERREQQAGLDLSPRPAERRRVWAGAHHLASTHEPPLAINKLHLQQAHGLLHAVEQDSAKALTQTTGVGATHAQLHAICEQLRGIDTGQAIAGSGLPPEQISTFVSEVVSRRYDVEDYASLIRNVGVVTFMTSANLMILGLLAGYTLARASKTPGPLTLMDSGVSTKPRAHASVHDGSDSEAVELDLPVWTGTDGSLRIGVPKRDPQHAGDMGQLQFASPAVLIAAIAAAMTLAT